MPPAHFYSKSCIPVVDQHAPRVVAARNDMVLAQLCRLPHGRLWRSRKERDPAVIIHKLVTRNGQVSEIIDSHFKDQTRYLNSSSRVLE